MTSALQYEFYETIREAQDLLQKDDEWNDRYKKYAKDIAANIENIKKIRGTFCEWSPLKLYLTTSNAKNTSKTVRFELRYLGQTVADLICKDSPKLDTNKYEETNKRDFDCEVALTNAEWKGKGAQDFRKHFKSRLTARNTNGKRSNEEHRLESLLLTEFSKNKSKDKVLLGFQPVKIAKVRFPMPTPFRASKHNEIKYSGASGGGIDILTRVRTADKSINLCILELKDENIKKEPPKDAVKQAIAYATFIRELLRSDSGEEWWKLFGFRRKLPDKLVLLAACVMPSIANDDKSFANISLDINDNKGEDRIVLHYLYFKEKDNEIIEIETSL